MNKNNTVSCTVMTLCLLLFGTSLSYAQLNQGGTPVSFDLSKSAIQLSSVPTIQMAPIDVEALRQEDIENDLEPAIPFRFAENIAVDINPSTSGVWDEYKDGNRIWRVTISSPGAETLNFQFDQYHLPKGAELFIYNKDKSDILGAFTHLNNQEDGLFATTLIRGDEVTIEYHEPDFVEFEGQLNLSQVSHGYRSLSYGKSASFGSSGSCNMNVACPEAEPWNDQVRSAARMVVNGNSWCSGQLINNTNDDGTPYFLSANHCFTNPGNVVFWFNYQSPTCENPPSQPGHDALSGAVNVARHSASDVWLMQLNHEPPAEYEPYFSGWNRTMDEEIEGYIFGVHHPSGDIKKFSYLFDGVTTSSYLGAPGSGTTHWRVGTWADGTTTEPGSSGSALFDGEGHIIGQLHGGYAACGNTLEDWYGKLGVSWDGGGTPETRLSDWLDPAGTGVETHPGYDPFTALVDVDAQMLGISSPSGSYQVGDDIVAEFRVRNAGQEPLTSMTVSYSVEGGPSASMEWSGELETGQIETFTFDPFTLSHGDYTISATVDAPGDENPDNNTRTTDFRVVDCSLAGRVPFFEDFDSSSGRPECWDVIDHQGNGQVWQFGTNGRGSNSLPPEFGNYAYLDSDAYGSGNSQNSDLVTPRIDLTNFENVELSFDHYFRDFNSSTATVSYSTDDGETWIDIEQWDSGQTDNPASFSQIINELDGESQVRIKWNYQGTYDWYWSVDNISVDGDRTGYSPANVRVLHLSADPSFSTLTASAGNGTLANEISFRELSEYFDVPSEEEITLTFSNASGDEIHSMSHTFTEFGEYTLMLTGVEDPAGFAPNPDALSTQSELIFMDASHESPSDNNMAMIYFIHASTDAPSVDIGLLEGPTVASGLSYGTNYSDGYFELAADAHYLEIFDSVTGDRLFVFETDLSEFDGKTLGIVASGFANPAENQNGAPFALHYLSEDGTFAELRNATSADPTDEQLPREVALSQNYPNPFNPTTQINYQVPAQSDVRLDVYNVQGQRVATLVNGSRPAGNHSVTFDASNLASGVYIYRLQVDGSGHAAGTTVLNRKMLLIK